MSHSMTILCCLLSLAAPAGEPIADFELRDLDGTAHRLASFKDRKVVVIALVAAGCPITRNYAARLEALAREFEPKGVQFLAVSSSKQDEVPALRAFQKEFGLTFPVLKDHDARVADLLGAERVPEVFVLDPARRLLYRGRIDDQYLVGDRSVGVRKDHPEANYLRDALDAALAGSEVAVKRTEAVGCVIGRTSRDGGPTPVTFHEHVEPIIQAKCQPCHRPGQIGPFPLTSFEDAAGWDGMIAEVVSNGRMPPWHADPHYGRFSNDRSLSPEEKETIRRWVAGGSRRGDPAKAPPPRVFPSDDWTIGKPDAVFEMPRTFQVPATGKVSYKHFVVDTGFEEDRWVQAMEVRAGSRPVVHHILVFLSDPRDPKAWERETGGGTKGYFAAMVPGERPTVFPEGMAKKLPKGSRLVFQVHYTTNGTAAEDRSKIGLIFARGPVQHEVRTRTAVNMALWIPARSERQVLTAQHHFSRPATILSFLPHMHLRGWSFRYELLHPARQKVSRSPFDGDLDERVLARVSYDAGDHVISCLGPLSDEAFAALSGYYTTPEDRKAIEALRNEARSEVLLDVPAYDFGWQSTYVLAEPKAIEAGATLECIAVYNNSASNPALTREMWEKPVRWGNQTWEEMLIGYFDSVDGSAAPQKSPGD